MNSFKCPAEIVGRSPQIMSEGTAGCDRTSDKQTKQKAPPATEQKTAGTDLCPATGEAVCHFSPWRGPHFPSFGNPKESKVNRTEIPMGLNDLILCAIWNCSPTRTYLRLKEKLQS